MKLRQPLTLIRFTLVLLSAVATVLFSSCNPVKMKDQSLQSLTQQSLNGGDVYGGKQFVLPNATACTDGRAIKAVIVLNAAGSYSLVRDNCQYLQTPQDVISSEVKNVTSTSIEYRGETYKEQFTGLPLYYVQGVTTKWCRGKVSTLDPVGSTALIEFSEQGDGQFKGEIGWLDYSSGSYTYYSSHELRIYKQDAVNGISTIALNGVDLKVSPSLNVNASIDPAGAKTATLSVGSSSININLECTGF
jgi:hypothetical protein